MKVSELAKELNTTSDELLKAFKALKLKAKSSDQDLNAVVVSVVRSQFSRVQKEAAAKKKAKAEEKPVKKKAVKKTAKKKEEGEEELKEEKKGAKKKAAKKKDEKEEKATVTKAKQVKVEKKEVKKEEEKSAEKEASKKKAEEKPAAPRKRKISREPVITLKPLARRKKRSTREDKTSQMSAEAAALKEGAVPLQEAELQDETAVPEAIPRDERFADLEIKVPITVKDLGVKIQQKPSVVLGQLMKMGIMANINQSLGSDLVGKLTQHFGINFVNIKTQEESLIELHKEEEEDPSLLKTRAPVVTLMGHVDHGKTTLLDRIRKSKVADREYGGITQHMGAYSVAVNKGKITFLDTPGHEAFTSMRARGAHITDLVILVVAADEGIMPQTVEAIDHAKAADAPIVVALTKIDRPNADPDRVKKQLAEHNLASEDWGGKTVVVGVSAITGDGIDELLELILLESEMLELKANDKKKGSGIVVEAHLSQGKGAVSTLIVQSGTLKEAEMIVVGPHYGKVKAMFNDHNQPVKEAGPSMPVEILGLPGVPEAGERFYVVEDERQAKEITLKRQEQIKYERLHSKHRLTLEDIYSQVEQGEIKELNVILKSDVQGSLEALKDSLEKIPSDKVRLNFIHIGVGEVNASDIVLAVASNAIIIAFHVGISVVAKEELKKEPVDVREYRIIYDAVDDIRNALEGLLEAKTKKNFLSRIEIREVFKLSKSGTIAGCYVTKGKVSRKAHVDVIRNDEIIYTGVLSSLKRFKDDVKEVTEGMECGVAVEGFDKYEVGDIIEAYEIEKIAQKL